MKEKFEKLNPEAMIMIGELMDSLLNEEGKRDIGFAVFIFPTGSGKRETKYVSNCQRADIMKAISEWQNQARTKMN